LAGITQEQLAEQAGLHVNSIRYLERQRWITTGHSSELVAEALAGMGVIFFTIPTCGIRLTPAMARNSETDCCWSLINTSDYRRSDGAGKQAVLEMPGHRHDDACRRLAAALINNGQTMPVSLRTAD
jgi:hypothetical protein